LTKITSNGVVQVARMKRTRHMRRLFENCLEIREGDDNGRGAPRGLAQVPEAQSFQHLSARDPTVLEAKRKGGTGATGYRVGAQAGPGGLTEACIVCQSQPPTPPSPTSFLHSFTSIMILSHSFHQCCHTTTMFSHRPRPRQGMASPSAAQRHADLEPAYPASRSKRSK